MPGLSVQLHFEITFSSTRSCSDASSFAFACSRLVTDSIRSRKRRNSVHCCCGVLLSYFSCGRPKLTNADVK